LELRRLPSRQSASSDRMIFKNHYFFSVKRWNFLYQKFF
jgi:hypothetical protein